MSVGGYKIRDQSAVHFISFAAVEWIDVLNHPAARSLRLQNISTFG